MLCSLYSKNNRNSHIRQEHQKKTLYDCHQCGRKLNTKDHFQSHIQTHLKQEKRKIPHDKVNLGSNKRRQSTFEDEFGRNMASDMDIASELQHIFHENCGAIRTYHYEGTVQSMYNIRWSATQSSPDWDKHSMPIFDRHIKRFKINLSHSFVLKHRENESNVFFTPPKTMHGSLIHHASSTTKKTFSLLGKNYETQAS